MLLFYYIPINDLTIELSDFWPFDTESRINELRSSDSVSLSFKMRPMLATFFNAKHVVISKKSEMEYVINRL